MTRRPLPLGLAMALALLAPITSSAQTRDFVSTNRLVFGTPADLTASIVFADVDGDGDPDLVLANRDGQANQILFNDGALGFDEVREFGTGSDETRGVALADFNADGVLDIVAVNIGEPNAVYLGTGGGRFDAGTTFGADERSYSVAVADLDGDGDEDLVVGNVGERNAVYFNDGTGRGWTELLVGEEAEATYGVAAADVDGDGLPELGFANSEALNRLFMNVGRR